MGGKAVAGTAGSEELESASKKIFYLCSGISYTSDSPTKEELLGSTPISFGGGMVQSHPVTKQHSRLNSIMGNPNKPS